MSNNNRRLANAFSSYLEDEKKSVYKSTTYSYGKYNDDECKIYFFKDCDLTKKPIVFTSRKLWEEYKEVTGISFKSRTTEISHYSEEYLSVYPDDPKTIACGSYSQTRLEDLLKELVLHKIKDVMDNNINNLTFKDIFTANDLKELKESLSIVEVVEC